ncbi:MAG: CGNR zinc finger domain-containing protein [Paludisphaera borealis]|uniref:CGNR zinc finger domain-containing protein n=1 Tax=Paludisphaera borealis TaxID=1387353 RepID=UPI00283B4C20|nr:ABATE domain-containing protein [Paludisphaera borealis]MDR3617858.1 CGNR zinc finger domain-containing protein [Paludisphaera borealis]
MSTDPSPRPPAIFVGDHTALDFLNSRCTPLGVWTEWLRDGADLLDWLEKAGAIEGAAAARFRAGGDCYAPKRLDDVAEQARDLREWLRDLVSRRAGREIDAEVMAELGPLNERLARDSSYLQVEGSPPDEGRARPLSLKQVRRWATPEDLLQPIAEAIGDLICTADFRLIRVCEGTACTLMFLDRTKAHARRWCSMAVCGNRAKAAAYRARSSRGDL